jgi:hypothetical protein
VRSPNFPDPEEVKDIDVKVENYKILGEPTKDGVIGYADLTINGIFLLYGVAYGRRPDGKEFAIPSGFPGKTGMKGRYQIYKPGSESILKSLHKWFEEKGLEV